MNLTIGFLISGDDMKRDLDLEQVTTIIKLTKEGVFKPEISRKIGASKSSVLKFQKYFNLI